MPVVLCVDCFWGASCCVGQILTDSPHNSSNPFSVVSSNALSSTDFFSVCDTLLEVLNCLCTYVYNFANVCVCR